MRILLISEIVGKSGVFCIKKQLSQLKEVHSIDIVIANADGATGGYGLGKNHAIYLRKLGVDVLVGGDQIFYKQDLYEHLPFARYIVRPANLPPDTPGYGIYYHKLSSNELLLVVSLIGQAQHRRIFPDNPFSTISRILKHAHTKNIVIDYHALMTSEKAAMCHYLAGKVSAVIGSGVRVQTSDSRILSGTACITDLGRTGSIDSVSGWQPAQEISKFLNHTPIASEISFSGMQIQGAVLAIDQEGRATTFDIINLPVPHQAESA